MGSCTAQCKMLLFCANTVERESAKFELARLKKEEEENRFWRFGNFLASDSYHSIRDSAGLPSYLVSRDFDAEPGICEEYLPFVTC